MLAYLLTCQESNVRVCGEGAEEHYFNTRRCIYSSDFAHTIALSVAHKKARYNLQSSSVINRNRNRKESESPCLSKYTLVHWSLWWQHWVDQILLDLRLFLILPVWLQSWILKRPFLRSYPQLSFIHPSKPLAPMKFSLKITNLPWFFSLL